MFQELKPDQFEAVRSLFRDFDYSLSIHAAIEGNIPGRIFVNDLRLILTKLHSETGDEYDKLILEGMLQRCFCETLPTPA